MARDPGVFSPSDYAALGELRYRIRHFLRFSELAARQEGLEPQQHQLLLAVRSLEEPEGPTVGQIADWLLVRHHSAVGLIDRLEDHKLVERVRAAEDRRQVRVRLTAQGEHKLQRLSLSHREELRSSGPRLVEALGELLRGFSSHAAVRNKKEEDVSAAPPPRS